ncbi:hypothetical protein CPC197_0767A, partial [Chlamydia psittaci C1/97]
MTIRFSVICERTYGAKISLL